MMTVAESRASNYECTTNRNGERGEKRGAGRKKRERRGFRAFVMENGGKY